MNGAGKTWLTWRFCGKQINGADVIWRTRHFQFPSSSARCGVGKAGNLILLFGNFCGKGENGEDQVWWAWHQGGGGIVKLLTTSRFCPASNRKNDLDCFIFMPPEIRTSSIPSNQHFTPHGNGQPQNWLPELPRSLPEASPSILWVASLDYIFAIDPEETEPVF